MNDETHVTNDIPSEAEPQGVLHSPVVQPRRIKKGVAKRTKNFSQKEDEVICSAWLNVSKNPITGANQSRSTFWSRVHAYFETNKTTTEVRTESSAMHRWLTIQAQVNKFCSCYDSIERRHQSEKTIHDEISDACELYKGLDQDNKAFTLIPCWTKLKDEDKWKARMVEIAEQEMQTSNKKQKVNVDSTPTNVEDANTEEEIAAVAPGRKKKATRCEEGKRSS
ncbi:glutathione S-transferase T3-like [Oryza brachyantha]|uniref:glutathione S-transferase T3-like n=1 Tax=Oryza brachyantha TaxID=4533 RepID=UPI0007768F54|nr:glutathione S-transferase T3-like [Oryza brachyantha]